MNKTLTGIGIIGGGFVGYGFATRDIIPILVGIGLIIFAGIMWKDRNSNQNKQPMKEEFKLSDRYYIDLSKPYALIDKEVNMTWACPHCSNGFCDKCWDKFIDAGLDVIEKEWEKKRRKEKLKEVKDVFPKTNLYFGFWKREKENDFLEDFASD